MAEGERNFTVHECDQRSDDWKEIRLGKLTGSAAGDMLATIKSGESADRRNLRIRLILERLTKKSLESTFTSRAMEVGIEREADALAAYEAKTGQLMERTGFLAHTSLMAGCSLDAHLGDFDTLISVKCRQPAAHWDFLRKGTIPSKAWAQMRHEMWITDALEHSYVSWNPDFPERMQLKIAVFSADAFLLSEYDGAARLFLAEVDLELSTMAGWAA